MGESTLDYSNSYTRWNLYHFTWLFYAQTQLTKRSQLRETILKERYGDKLRVNILLNEQLNEHIFKTYMSVSIKKYQKAMFHDT